MYRKASKQLEALTQNYLIWKNNFIKTNNNQKKKHILSFIKDNIRIIRFVFKLKF